MKNRVKKSVLLLVAVASLAISVMIYITSREQKKEAGLLQKVKVGMSSAQVTEIMGIPDTIVHREDSTFFFNILPTPA